MIELLNIDYTISRKRLLQDISLNIHEGQITALIGPNGAGKSTLFKIATGELSPTGGAVHITTGVPLTNRVDRTTFQAVVNQSSPLNFPFPVFEVVLMGRTPHMAHRESKLDIELAWKAMQYVRIEHLANQSYTTLSGGERQRVHLARAIAQLLTEEPDDKPRYLFLDEPTSNLDITHQHDVFELLGTLALEQHIGVFIVVHDLNLAAQYANTVLLLKEGKIITAGKPEHVMIPYFLEKVFSLSVQVIAHPCRDCPLIVPLGRASSHVLPFIH